MVFARKMVKMNSVHEKIKHNTAVAAIPRASLVKVFAKTLKTTGTINHCRMIDIDGNVVEKDFSNRTIMADLLGYAQKLRQDEYHGGQNHEK